MRELTEDQFKLLKDFVRTETKLIFLSSTLETDAPDKVREHAKLASDIHNLFDNGFLKNVTENFTDTITEVKRKTKRSSEVYALEPIAFQMFDPDRKVN